MPIADLAAGGQRCFGQRDRARMLPGAAAGEREVVQCRDADAGVADAFGDRQAALEMSALTGQDPEARKRPVGRFELARRLSQCSRWRASALHREYRCGGQEEEPARQLGAQGRDARD